MCARVEIGGQRFGRWLVLGYSGDMKWMCRCDCGTEKNVHGTSLRRGATNGCISCHPGLANQRTHGDTRSRIYNVWSGMIQRCENPNSAAYPRYGGRGIFMCREWRNSYEAFRDWARSNGYSDSLTIDRSNNDAGYSPSNCRWATYAEQNRNYSRNRPIEHDGRVALIGDFAFEHNLPDDVVRNRVRRYGWTMEAALSAPVQTRMKREPWIDHGMSRSAYYRAKKDAAITFTVRKGNIDD